MHRKRGGFHGGKYRETRQAGFMPGSRSRAERSGVNEKQQIYHRAGPWEPSGQDRKPYHAERGKAAGGKTYFPDKYPVLREGVL